MKPIQLRIKEWYDFLETSVLISDAMDKVWYPCIITIRKDVAWLSENQRNYYFAVPVKIIQDYTWYTKDETHRMLKAQFLIEYDTLLQNIIQPTGNDEKMFQLARFISLCDDITITTSDKGEFEIYLRKIRNYYSDINIPLPNEQQRWEWWERILN